MKQFPTSGFFPWSWWKSGARLALVFMLSFPWTAIAGGQEGQLDNIIVTGTRTTADPAEIPTAISVIDLTEIEARNAVTITDLLQGLAGLHVIQPSGQGGVARVFVRGGDQNLTMILVDGVRVNDPLDSRGSAFDFSTINLSDVDRIEIVRGPHSAVYGSDALAGVINIITKNQVDEFGGSIIAEAGTDGYHRGALDIQGPVGTNGGFSLRFATKDDGDPVPGTAFSGDSVSGRVSLGDRDQWGLKLFANYADSDGTAFPEDSGGSRLAVLRDVDTRSAEDLRFGLSGNTRLSESWRLNFLATKYDHEAEFFSPGVAPGVRDPVPPNGATADLDRFDIAVNAVVEVNDVLTATFGLDYYEEDGVSDGFVEFFPGFNVPAGFSFGRSVTGAFGEFHARTDSGLSLLGSLRRDDPDNESGESTSRLGVKYDWPSGLASLQANWGQGFALPGFFALASPLVGNPDLRPETSESYDFGVTFRRGDGRLGITATVFHNEFENLIDFDASVFQMVNRDTLEADGVELQMTFDAAENLQIEAHATYMDLSLAGTSDPLRQRPEWRGGLSVSWDPSESWQVHGSWLSIGETVDSSIPTGAMKLDGYQRADVTITFRQSDALNLLLSVDNFLDESYEQAIGFVAPGTRARLGLRFLF